MSCVAPCPVVLVLDEDSLADTRKPLQACRFDRESRGVRAIVSPGVAQACGDSVDREMDAAANTLVGLVGLAAAAVALDQFDLQVVERIEVRQAIADVARERGTRFEQLLLPAD